MALGVESGICIFVPFRFVSLRRIHPKCSVPLSRMHREPYRFRRHVQRQALWGQFGFGPSAAGRDGLLNGTNTSGVAKR
jgi:hypothetical protein